MGGQEQSQDAARAVESLLAFWAGSGVDALYADAPIDRMQPIVRPKAVDAAPIATNPGVTARAPAINIAAAVAQATELAAAANDLDALAAAVAAFDGCSLKIAGARQSVFSRGATDAQVVVIGEGPGEDEDAQGQPFVGRAGKLLDRMLLAAGLTDRVFITNTVFWRPPGNRTPTPEEQAVCRPFVDRAIMLIKPSALLLVGGAAGKSILNRDEGILALRGRWFEWSSPDNTLVLPALATLHPAFLLRQPAAKKKSWSDLLTLSERVDRAERAP